MKSAPIQSFERPMSDALATLLQQLPESVESSEEWQEIARWAEEIYLATGRPATLDDLYRDLPTLKLDEEFDIQEPGG